MSGTVTGLRAVAVALGAFAACYSERPRPGPPLLQITLSKTTAHAPDTVTGTARAEDASGVDSVWLSLDGAPATGQDGQFQTVVESSFRVVVTKGRPVGDAVPIQLRARDVEGFVSTQDTAIPIVLP